MKRRDALKMISTAPILGATKLPFSPQHILVAGAHPDDPETGCGGAIATWVKLGHKVTIVYLTTGEAGIEELNNEKAAAIRKKEALAACKILGVEAVFMGQIDGDTVINKLWYEKTKQLIEDLMPDLILTHWPVDSHRDHRACSLLFYDAWLYGNFKEAFYYYEVMSGVQSQNFNPTNYVDISGEIDIKHRSCNVHKSQFIEENYHKDHGKMEPHRGIEAGCDFAEAFIKHSRSKTSNLFI